ncbi:MAG: CBS domain-containing protein [candidate division Zixibacteria bacterium]|nr:CBS domain-containing protein [candidate division Zixibacteria bacterium]
MKLYRARDVMIPLDQYPHIPHWFTLRQAIAELEQFQFEIAERKSLPRFVLVFDEEYRLLGLVRRRDILRGLEPEFLARFVAGMEDTADDDPGRGRGRRFIDLIKKAVEKPVSDVMVRIDLAVDIDDNIIDIAHRIVESDTSLVPVTRDGEVVGVVRTVELVHEVARIVK